MLEMKVYPCLGKYSSQMRVSLYFRNWKVWGMLLKERWIGFKYVASYIITPQGNFIARFESLRRFVFAPVERLFELKKNVLIYLETGVFFPNFLLFLRSDAVNLITQSISL